MKSFDFFTLNTIMDPLVYTIIICCLSAPHSPFTARLMILAISPLSAGTVLGFISGGHWRHKGECRRQKYVQYPPWTASSGTQREASRVLSLGNLTGLCHTLTSPFSMLFLVLNFAHCIIICLGVRLSHYQDISSFKNRICLLVTSVLQCSSLFQATAVIANLLLMLTQTM